LTTLKDIVLLIDFPYGNLTQITRELVWDLARIFQPLVCHSKALHDSQLKLYGNYSQFQNKCRNVDVPSTGAIGGRELPLGD
jgi:hypothetical protein